MGAFIWHQWGRYVAIFACVYTFWAGLWGIFFRKFFWDFVNGRIRLGPNNRNGRPCADNNPCGIQPARSDQIFVMLIVTAPIVQLLSILFASAHLTLELLPACKKLAIYRSWALRIVTYTIQAFLASLFYQGTNGALYSAIAAIAYIMAQVNGEELEEAKEQRGRGGGGSGGEKA